MSRKRAESGAEKGFAASFAFTNPFAGEPCEGDDLHARIPTGRVFVDEKLKFWGFPEIAFGCDAEDKSELTWEQRDSQLGELVHKTEKAGTLQLKTISGWTPKW